MPDTMTLRHGSDAQFRLDFLSDTGEAVDITGGVLKLVLATRAGVELLTIRSDQGEPSRVDVDPGLASRAVLQIAQAVTDGIPPARNYRWTLYHLVGTKTFTVGTGPLDVLPEGH